MKKHTISGLFLALSFAAFSQTRSITDVQCLPKLSEKTRIVTLLSDNTLWWSINGGYWQQISTAGLPDGKKMVGIELYTRYTMSTKKANLVSLLDDNTLWLYEEEGSWQKISSDGLPDRAVIKFLRSYTSYNLGNVVSKFAVVLEDNTIWECRVNKKWETVPMKGLPDNYVITGINIYQNPKGSHTTYYTALLADNTIWRSVGGKKWNQIEVPVLPGGGKIKKMLASMRGAMPTKSEELVFVVLADESIWWFSPSQRRKEAIRIEGKAFPKDYQINIAKIYQAQLNGMDNDIRLVFVLNDNSIWWWSAYESWGSLDTEELLQ